jgi:hypothetical protein
MCVQSLEAAGLNGPIHEIVVITYRVSLLPMTMTLADLPSRPTALQVRVVSCVWSPHVISC